jgi:hypothetical protein
MFATRLVAFFVLALLITGCADKFGGRVEVVGEVQLKGQPIKDGVVMFEPLDGQDTRVNSIIINGSYKVERENGLKPGKYLIRVTAGDNKSPVNVFNPNEGPGPSAVGSTNVISKELIPESWNTKSKETRTITSESPNTINLDIK